VPFTNAGGFTTIAPGAEGTATLHLPPGQYLATDFLPDPATGAPHFATGVLQPFSVGA
jgi:hypothetical protein